MDKFTYLGSSVSSIENDINTWLAKAWTAIDKLSVIWKLELTDKIKCSFFFQAGVVLILLYGCTTWMLTKRLEKKLNSNYIRMLQAILNKSCTTTYHPSWKLSKLHVGHSWRSKDELISDVLLWTPTHDIGCSLEDLPGVMYDREGQRDLCWQHNMMMMMIYTYIYNG